jgi:hypothetical protein
MASGNVTQPHDAYDLHANANRRLAPRRALLGAGRFFGAEAEGGAWRKLGLLVALLLPGGRIAIFVPLLGRRFRGMCNSERRNTSLIRP